MAEGRHNSHAVTWTLAMLAVPVLYVLTLPLVVVVARKTYEAMLGGYSRPPAWLETYATPLEWLYQTPLKQPIEAYFDWVARCMGL